MRGSNFQSEVCKTPALPLNFCCAQLVRSRSPRNRLFDLGSVPVVNERYDARRQVFGEYFEEDWSTIEPVSVELGIRRNGCGCSGVFNGSQDVQPPGIARSYLTRRCDIAMT